MTVTALAAQGSHRCWTGPADNVNQLKKSNTQAINNDANGNLLDDGKHYYSCDAENRLVKIVNNQNGHISTFVYDGAGKRVAILEQDNAVGPTTETRYVWSGTKIVSAYQNGVQKTLYYPQGEFWGSKTKRYYSTDQIGSVIQLLDANGNQTGNSSYSAFGQPLSQTGEQGDYGYAGMFQHKPSGLSLTYYRAYDPNTGRWTTRDPMGEAGGINLYGYVGGNPVNNIDPWGLFVRVQQSGNTIVLTLPVHYFGAGVNQNVINKFNAGIEKYWTGKFGRYNVTTRVIEPCRDTPGNDMNDIDVPKGNGRAYVLEVGGNAGHWPAERPGWTAAHEAGHLMGLPDLYDPITGNPLSGAEQDIMGARDMLPSENDIKNILRANQ